MECDSTDAVCEASTPRRTRWGIRGALERLLERIFGGGGS